MVVQPWLALLRRLLVLKRLCAYNTTAEPRQRIHRKSVQSSFGCFCCVVSLLSQLKFILKFSLGNRTETMVRKDAFI